MRRKRKNRKEELKHACFSIAQLGILIRGICAQEEEEEH
jgi:hypothetical protein